LLRIGRTCPGLYSQKEESLRRYETFVIIDPDISEEQRSPIIERATDLISQENGLTVKVDEWGKRKLAYEIKKKPRGYYVLLDFCGNASIVDEMERFFRIDDRVMKYMTVLLDRDVDMEKIKEDLDRAQAEREASAAAKTKSDDEQAAPEGETVADESSIEAVESETEVKPEAEAVEPAAAETEAETTESETEVKPEAETVESAAAETEAKKEES
jgi:small subunit ribosomal protein S6